MKTKALIVPILLALAGHVIDAAEESQPPSSDYGVPGRTQGTPLFAKLADAKWSPIVPELGADSPQLCILHVDPTTKATQLLIRAPKAIHVRKHWHTANETHTMIQGTATFACDGQKAELGPGGFNYMPSKMVHEAWLSAGTLVFITVDAAWDNNWVEGPPTAADLMK